jgi:predicted Zn-dependent peptidase
MEEIGANITISSSRDYLIYSGECLREHLPIVIDYTADSIKNPLFLDEEIQEQRVLHDSNYLIHFHKSIH